MAHTCASSARAAAKWDHGQPVKIMCDIFTVHTGNSASLWIRANFKYCSVRSTNRPTGSSESPFRSIFHFEHSSMDCRHLNIEIVLMLRARVEWTSPYVSIMDSNSGPNAKTCHFHFVGVSVRTAHIMNPDEPFHRWIILSQLQHPAPAGRFQFTKFQFIVCLCPGSGLPQNDQRKRISVDFYPNTSNENPLGILCIYIGRPPLTITRFRMIILSWSAWKKEYPMKTLQKTSHFTIIWLTMEWTKEWDNVNEYSCLHFNEMLEMSFLMPCG